MQFFKSVQAVAAVAPALSGFGVVTAPRDLDVNDPTSIINVASSIAYSAMSYYVGNVSSNSLDVGALPNPPYYWWQAGSLWNLMLDYYHYTGDWTYNDELIVALLAPQNLGVNLDYLAVERMGQEGNDDLGFWGGAAMTAAEINFPQPDPKLPSWLQLAANVFNSLVSRWDASSCGGGLLWQIYAGNPNGLTYKNAVSNGGFMLLASRLYRATGNTTYLTWATTVWDWSVSSGLIDKDYFVFDGLNIANCGAVNKLMFTYSSGIYLYSTALLANATSEQVWADRSAGLLRAAVAAFFHPPNTNPNQLIMFEPACEPGNTCNADMRSHKATLARFLWKTGQMQPALYEQIKSTLTLSVAGAAQACTGGTSGWACGSKWYADAFDGSAGCGQEMSALSIVQGLLVLNSDPPYAGSDIKVVRDRPWLLQSPSFTPTPTTPSPATSVLSTRSAPGTPSKTNTGVRGRFGVQSISTVLVGLASTAMVHLGLN